MISAIRAFATAVGHHLLQLFVPICLGTLAAWPCSVEQTPQPRGSITVAAVQARLLMYSDAAAFASHMEQLVKRATGAGAELVVFPEDIGIGLISVGDYDAIASAGTLADATRALASAHASEVDALSHNHNISVARALWLFKADSIRSVYENTFATLARKYKVTIIAGSVPLVPPDQPGAVYNTCCLFTRAGKLVQMARKVHLIEIEQAGGLDLCAADQSSLQVYHLQGRAGACTLGCLVCADAWDPDLARAVVDKGANVLVQVSANPEVWDESVADNWRLSLYSRVQELGTYGILSMGVGQLFDLPFQGRSQVLGPAALTANASGILSQAATVEYEEIVCATLDLSRLPH